MEKNITLTHRAKVSKFNIFIEYLFLALVFLILIPAGVLVITKDSLPGDPLYTYKVQIENSALSLTKGTSLEIPLKQIITGRRLQERELLQKLDSNKK